jgi:putative transcriptional regulator
MTVHHHPDQALMAAFAAGTLDQARSAVIATHLLACSTCRSELKVFEDAGGALLETLSPVPLSHDAWSRVEGLLSHGSPASRSFSGAKRASLGDVPGLPDSVQRLSGGNWRWLAPSLEIRRIDTPHGEAARLFLLRSRAGTRLLPHAHSGEELTCVLAGSFFHDGELYGPGDFDFGEPSVEHEIEIGSEGSCVSLVAMTGELKYGGLLGRIAQPFFSI